MHSSIFGFYNKHNQNPIENLTNGNKNCLGVNKNTYYTKLTQNSKYPKEISMNTSENLHS